MAHKHGPRQKNKSTWHLKVMRRQILESWTAAHSGVDSAHPTLCLDSRINFLHVHFFKLLLLQTYICTKLTSKFPQFLCSFIFLPSTLSSNLVLLVNSLWAFNLNLHIMNKNGTPEYKE